MAHNERIRHEILLQCYGYRPAARDAERMARAARHEGEIPDAVAAEFARECAYLQGKGLIALEPDELARGHKRWAITSAGIDTLEERGLI